MTGWWLVSYVALWAVCLTTLVVLLVVLRQLGLIYLRSGGGMRSEVGPPLGAILAPFEETAADGAAPVAFPVEDAEVNLLLFTSPGCRICAEALRGLPKAVKGLDVAVTVVSEGDAAENAELRRLIDGVGRFTASASRQRILGVDTFPYGVVTDAGGMVLDKGVINSIADVDGLLERGRAGAAGRDPVRVVWEGRGAQG